MRHRCRRGEKAHRGRLDGKEETGADGDAGQIICTDVTGHGRVHEVHADGGDWAIRIGIIVAISFLR